MNFDTTCVDVEHFLESLDIRNITIGPVEATYSCPFPNHANGDDTPSAQMNLETTAFRCYGCKERGNAVHFASGVLGISPLEAIRMLRVAYDPGAYDPDQVSVVSLVEEIRADRRQKADPEQPDLPESLVERYAVDWYAVQAAVDNGEPVPDSLTYMLRRGFSPEILEDWEFGYDGLTDRVTFAIRDENGKLVGFKGRAYDDRIPKYLVLGDKQQRRRYHGYDIYRPDRIVFGAHRLHPGGTIVICEGEFNAIAVSARSGENSVALSGSYFSDRHARIIRNYADDVILFLDHDKAGKEATWGWTDARGMFHPGIVQRLQDHMPVMLAPLLDRDAADLTAAQIDDALNGAESALVRSLAA